MRRFVVLLLALLAIGCVRETVSCTVLGHDDPLCQDPDANVDADMDAAVEDADVDAAEEVDAGADAAG